MNTPIIIATLTGAEDNSHFVGGDKGNVRMLRNLAAAVETLMNGVAAGKIWNVEYQNAYDDVRSAVEHAFDVEGQKHLDEFRKASETWNRETDPRMVVWYHPAFNNVPGAVKRLQKYANDPLVVPMMPLFVEAVQLLELCKLAKAVVVKGRRPVEKTEAEVAADLSNTGVCAICGRRQKLDANQKMVHHGYQMSEYNHAGYRMGKCFGTGYAPYELSNEANVAYAPVLENHRKQIAKTLKELKSGNVTSLTVLTGFGKNATKTYTKAENPVEFERQLGYEIDKTEDQLRYVREDIKVNAERIQNWTLQPLKYGTKEN